MLHRITVATSYIFIMMILIMQILLISLVNCKVIENPNNLQMHQVLNTNSEDVDSSSSSSNQRQLLLLTGVGKETSTPDFIRLVIMRLVYGLASSMGVEDRIESLFNGAFVPPNADGDLFGFGGLGGDGDGGDFGDLAALDGLFDDGGF